jgi:hypothetical protein
VTNTGGGDPQPDGDDLSAHDNANGDGAERHAEAHRHASSTGCNTITSAIIIASAAIDGVNIPILTSTSVEQRPSSCKFPAFQLVGYLLFRSVTVESFLHLNFIYGRYVFDTCRNMNNEWNCMSCLKAKFQTNN